MGSKMLWISKTHSRRVPQVGYSSRNTDNNLLVRLPRKKHSKPMSCPPNWLVKGSDEVSFGSRYVTGLFSGETGTFSEELLEYKPHTLNKRIIQWASLGACMCWLKGLTIIILVLFAGQMLREVHQKMRRLMDGLVWTLLLGYCSRSNLLNRARTRILTTIKLTYRRLTHWTGPMITDDWKQICHFF